MSHATPVPDEALRQRTLERYRILDSLPEQAYEDIVRLASTLCDTPVALVSLIDRDRQWFKARTGFDEAQTSRSVAVCDHAIRTPDRLMEIPDLREDPRFAANPHFNGVAGDARFYAGMPLVTPEGTAIGTVCVLDDRPRALDGEQRAALESLARLTMTLLEARVRERALAHEAFVATAAPSVEPAASPRYTLALLELQDHAGAVARHGERRTEKLLEQIDGELEQALAGTRGDSANRTSGSAEYVLVLHGPDADAAMAKVRAVLERNAAAHGLVFLVGTAEGEASEPPSAVFMRADADLLARRSPAHPVH
ncbi:GAF domain-containing protein [Luteimonas kalidii]|uniref:GAF domain-containing protein n=1 Tax=Luteimonas kalidii TaxID=3042025 RepID=A0ABT6JWP7_9GAMM|nr:GAF domain-containing protein [Luteimonas kalidii]MDH5835115.1 GAF domain-containing protein [Luteimonas kalidii]